MFQHYYDRHTRPHTHTHTHTIASTIIASVHDGLITANRRKPQLLPPIDSRREEKIGGGTLAAPCRGGGTGLLGADVRSVDCQD